MSESLHDRILAAQEQERRKALEKQRQSEENMRLAKEFVDLMLENGIQPTRLKKTEGKIVKNLFRSSYHTTTTTLPQRGWFIQEPPSPELPGAVLTTDCEIYDVYDDWTIHERSHPSSAGDAYNLNNRLVNAAVRYLGTK